MDIGNGWRRLQATFSLSRDPILHARGVTISARVDWRESSAGPGDLKNRIVFQLSSGQEETVDCVHSVVVVLPASEVENIDWDAPENNLSEFHSTEDLPEAILSQAGHFAALKSFVEGIALIGLETALDGSVVNQEDAPVLNPFGFDVRLLQGVLNALNRLVPQVGQRLFREYLLGLATRVPGDWFTSRLPLLDEIFFDSDWDEDIPGFSEFHLVHRLTEDFQRMLFSDHTTSEFLLETVEDPKFWELAILSEFTPLGFAQELLKRLGTSYPDALSKIVQNWGPPRMQRLLFSDPGILKFLFENIDDPSFAESVVQSELTPGLIAHDLMFRLQEQDPTVLARITLNCMERDKQAFSPAIEAAWARASQKEIQTFLQAAKESSDEIFDEFSEDSSNRIPLARCQFPESLYSRVIQGQDSTTKRLLLWLPETPVRYRARLGYQRATNQFRIEVQIEHSRDRWHLVLGGEEVETVFEIPVEPLTPVDIDGEQSTFNLSIPSDWHDFLSLMKDPSKKSWTKFLQRVATYPYSDFCTISNFDMVPEFLPSNYHPGDDLFYEVAFQVMVFQPNGFQIFLEERQAVEQPWVLDHYSFRNLPIGERIQHRGGTIFGHSLEWFAACTRTIDSDYESAVTIATAPGVPFVCLRNNLSGLVGVTGIELPSNHPNNPHHPDVTSCGDE